MESHDGMIDDGIKLTFLRTFQQTPGTDPRYPKIQMWKDFLYKWLVEGLGYVRGVCRSFLRTLYSDLQLHFWFTLFFSDLISRFILNWNKTRLWREDLYIHIMWNLYTYIYRFYRYRRCAPCYFSFRAQKSEVTLVMSTLLLFLGGFWEPKNP